MSYHTDENTNMRHILFIVIIAFLFPAAVLAEPSSDTQKFQTWIQEMKQATRGPFRRIRWFCNDGSVLEPEPYACVEREGGLQHGEWNRKAKYLRKSGYQLANVLAVYSDKKSNPPVANLDTIKQILLERFLVGYDDGWILRKARYYRGAFQIADEIKGSQALLNKLIRKVGSNHQNYLLLMEAQRLLPQKGGSVLATRMRDKATKISEKDSGFERLRSKLHTQPEAGDANQIRDYAQKRGNRSLRTEYLELAGLIDKLFSPQDLSRQLRKLAKRNTTPALQKKVLLSAATFSSPKLSLEVKFLESSHLLAEMRQACPAQKISTQVQILQLGQTLEQTVFTTGSLLLATLESRTRLERLGWLRSTARSIYGVGLISLRQLKAVQDSINRIEQGDLAVGRYHAELRYLNRLPGWANNWLAYHFHPTIEHLEQIESLAQQYIPARLRGSPLQFYTAVLDSLLRDANQLAGVDNKFFDESIGSGLRSLNAGLARGQLLINKGNQPMDRKGIYLLPETTMELTPVAGILTRGEGNALSHVQLLAANLGIPNVVVDESVVDKLRNQIGKKIVLAVSSGGIVQLSKDDITWDAILKQSSGVAENMITPDLEKLDLEDKDLKLLSELRAIDSGRIVGPKAANLGELKHHFPGKVVEGLVIPFGFFREILDQPMQGFQGTLFEWMEQYYRYLSQLNDEKRNVAIPSFLKTLRSQINHSKLSQEFKNQLRNKLQQTFGEDGSYAVFVRSDTNVEDLPGFTGAGLNLTVPNVVGFEKIIDAIIRVWASPFSERAYAWRQGLMRSPQHVYPSVILMKTVPVEKSGVLITQDTETGDADWLSIAVNHGIGGAVQGQAAEELRIHSSTGEMHLLADASSSFMRLADRIGGLKKVTAPPTGMVLKQGEIQQLTQLVKQIKKEFPQYGDSAQSIAADIEFGFENGQLRLFQVRPYLRSQNARNNQYLISLDQKMESRAGQAVELSEVPQ